MRNIFQNYAPWLFTALLFCFAQTISAQWSGTSSIYPTTPGAKVGIGLNNPATSFHLKSTTVNPFRLESTTDFNWMSYYTAGTYKGYSGLVSGPYDMEFGTSNTNPTGKVHLTIGFLPKLTVDALGYVGIGTVSPSARFHVISNGGTIIRMESSATTGYLGFFTSGGYKGYAGVFNGSNDLDFGTGQGNTTGKVHLVTGTATSAVPRLTVIGTGSVGIGTTSPAAQLHVKSAAANTLRLESTTSATTNWMSFYVSNTEKGYAGMRSAGAMDFGTSTGNSANVNLVTKGSPKLTVTSDGNVGIGTTSPTAQLHVKSAGDNPLALETTGTDNWISFNTYDGYKGYAGVYNGDRDMEIGTGYTNTTGNVHLSIAAVPQLTVFANGNVGIGTASDTYRLSVNGVVRAKEVRVESDWADYVFEENFRLRPLAEVEDFIQEHKHLPDVTPAAEIQAEGLQVGQQMTEMMQKVEELTLYVIQLDKENAALRARVETLEAERR